MTVWRAAVAALTFCGLIIVGAPAASAQSNADSPWPTDWLYPEQGDAERWRTRRMGPQQKKRFERHQTFMSGPELEPYLSKSNPLEITPEVIGAGAALYTEQCLQCHGPKGFGDGHADLAVDPSPALLAFLVKMPRAVDGYLYWSIAAGGARFGSEMPAYQGLLLEDEIWKIIAFMRAGFGESSD